MKLTALTFAASLLSTAAFAAMPNTFEAGGVISAAQVNENFTHNAANAAEAKQAADNAASLAWDAEDIALNSAADVSTLSDSVTALLRVSSDNKEDIISLKNKHKSPYEAVVTYTPVTTNYGGVITLVDQDGVEVDFEMTQVVLRKVNGNYYIAKFPKLLGETYLADTVSSKETIVQTLNSGAEIDIHQSCKLVEVESVSYDYQSTCNYSAAIKVDTTIVSLFLTSDLVLFEQVVDYISAIYSIKGAL